MINSELRKKIRKIKIYTKRIMQSTLTGDYHSAFKGSGLEFDQLRDYQPGDDIRFIDWNSSAKMNKIMVKQYKEERDRTVILMIDLSASSNYSSQKELRKETAAQLAATLTFIAAENKDNVGVIFYSDHVEKYIKPSRGPLHIGAIVEHIFTIKPTSKKTNINAALRFLINLKKRNAIVFMLSDLIDTVSDYTRMLRIASIEYDFVCMRLLDQCEKEFPDIGFLDMQDPETGTTFTIDTRAVVGKKSPMNVFLQAYRNKQKHQFEKYKIDMLDLTVGKPIINPLVRFFHKRIRRQI